MDKFVKVVDAWSNKKLRIPLKGCLVDYYRKAFTIQESKTHLANLKKLDWVHQGIIVGGKPLKENRLTCCFSEDGEINYTYSGTTRRGESYPPEISMIKKRVEELLDNKYNFNFCLCNYYADGEHSIGFHSDDEPGLQFPIASVSFGAARKFKFRSRYKDPSETLTLEDGSLILMDNNSQKRYLHGIDKEKNTGLRINLTFRIIDTKDEKFIISQGQHHPLNKRIKLSDGIFVVAGNTDHNLKNNSPEEFLSYK